MTPKSGSAQFSSCMAWKKFVWDPIMWCKAISRKGKDVTTSENEWKTITQYLWQKTVLRIPVSALSNTQGETEGSLFSFQVLSVGWKLSMLYLRMV